MRTAFRVAWAVSLFLALSGCVVYPLYPPRFHPHRYFYGPY